jgi:hypothetical protein
MKHSQYVLGVGYYAFTYLENQSSIYYSLKLRKMQTRIISCTMLQLRRSRISIKTFGKTKCLWPLILVGETHCLNLEMVAGETHCFNFKMVTGEMHYFNLVMVIGEMPNNYQVFFKEMPNDH